MSEYFGDLVSDRLQELEEPELDVGPANEYVVGVAEREAMLEVAQIDAVDVDLENEWKDDSSI